MSNMGENAAWRMLQQGRENTRPPLPIRPQPRVRRILVDRVIPSYNEGEFEWPEIAPYGSLSFHTHIRQAVRLWNEFPVWNGATAFIDVAAEKMGYTVIHFDSFAEYGAFANHHMLHDAVLTQNFEMDETTGAIPGRGYVQIRNTFPRELIDSFLHTIVQGNHDLQIAVNRVSGMMQASRTALLSMTRHIEQKEGK